MPVGEWIQPDDMWVVRPLSVVAKTWYRVLSWSIDDYDPEDVTPTWIARWSHMVEDSTDGFVGLEASVDEITTSDETLYDAMEYPYGSYQTLPSQNLQNWQLFAEFSASTSIDDYPQYEPSVPGGVTVEYESEEGEYFDTHRFVIPYDTVGNFAAQELPQFAYTPEAIGVGAASDYPSVGAPFLAWDRTGDLNGVFGTQQITVDSADLTLTPIFEPHMDGPDTAGLRNASVYLGRLSESDPRLFSVSRLYTPPRYRLITPDGSWETRHMQGFGGGVGSWPHRQMQNSGRTGTWPLRGR